MADPAPRCARRPPRGVTWVWLTVLPVLVALLGIGLGLLLVSLRKSRGSRDAPPQPPAESRPALPVREKNGAAGRNETAPLIEEGRTPPSSPAAAGKEPAVKPSVPTPDPPPAVRKPSLETLCGKWSGRTEKDGVLTITVTPAGTLAYSFSDGCRERNQGRIRIRDQAIYYAEEGERHPVVWWACLDGAGRLHLQMEDDEEVYVLTRAK